jgi:hypothetical protein
MSRGGIVIRRTAALLGLGLLAISTTACSSGSNIKFDESASTVAPSAATAAPTTLAAPTTVPQALPSAAAAPESTVAPTEAPTTTISLEDQVRAAVTTNATALDACLVDPANCNVLTFTVPGSREAERMQKLVDRNVDVGLVSLIIPEFNSYLVESIRLGVDQRSAVVVMCVVDGNWVMDSMGTPDVADDVPVNDLLAAKRIEGLLTFAEGQWRWETFMALARWEGVAQCDA